MALFRIFKGNKNKLGAVPGAGEQDTRYAHEGFAYFTPDDGKFYIDIAGNTGDTNTPAVIGTNRIPLSADKADKDSAGNNIVNTYLTKASGITDVAWDNTNKKLTKTINGSTTDVVAVTVNNPTLAWNTESVIAKIGTVDVKVKLPANPNTNTTYTLSGALNNNTFVSTLTPSSGNATTATVPAMTAATASVAGKAGLVPAPAIGNNAQFLRGDGTWANPKEAYLEWGGRNFSASYGCIDAAMISELGANRFAFLKAAGLTIEYSTDGGSTWTDYGATDAQKTGLFGTGYNFVLGKHTTAGTNTTNDQLRVTIDTGAAGIYTALNKIAIYMSTAGNTVQVKLEKALQSTPTTYITQFDWTGISGWSGWNILNMGGIATYGNAAGSQYGRLRFIFKQTAVNTNYSSAYISKILGFGGVGWVVPSNLARNGHLYAYDNSQNAVFPANVTATKFIGPLQGNADTATKATQDGSGNVITSTYVKKAGDTMTGLLNLQANQYSDSYSGALNLNNSNIYGVNSIYTADSSNNAQEGFHFYRDATHVDTFYIKSGVPYLVANRELGTNGTSVPMARFSGAVTSGKVVVTDGTTGAVKAGTTSTATVIKTITFTAGEAPTTGDAIEADDITAWSAGTTPTLGDAISADDITAWSAGTLPTLGTAIPADDITAWNAGTSPSLTITTVNADDITAWDAGSVTTAAVENGVLTITTGTASSLSYTARSIGSASGWSAGTKPSLSYTAKSIPNVTGVGSLPSLSYTARTIPNVTSVGTAPSLTYTARSIPNITSVGSVPTLTTTTQNVITGIS